MQLEKMQDIYGLRLGDVVKGFMQHLLLIVSVSIGGGVASALLATLLPPSFEAVTLVRLAKQLDGAAIEPVQMLEARLRYPETFPSETINECGGASARNLKNYLENTIKIQGLKGEDSTISIKTSSGSEQAAAGCAGKIAELVIQLQQTVLSEQISVRQVQLERLQASLKAERGLLSKRKELGAFEYLAKAERLSSIQNRIEELEEEVMRLHKNAAKQLVPVHVELALNSPRRILMILMGGLAGLLLGMLYVLFRLARK